MTGLNLSEWALTHRSLTIFLMIVAVGAGIISYLRLGRSEDPSFVIKTMVVQPAHAARRHGRGNAQTSDRAARAYASGNAAPRLLA